jgi:hypothetical protein
MTKHAVRLQIRLAQVLRGDAGQGALEYVGMLIVVGVVASLAIAAITLAGPQVTTKVATAITNFLG